MRSSGSGSAQIFAKEDTAFDVVAADTVALHWACEVEPDEVLVCTLPLDTGGAVGCPGWPLRPGRASARGARHTPDAASASTVADLHQRDVIS